MRKGIGIILVLALLLGCTGCSSEKEDQYASNQAPKVVSEFSNNEFCGVVYDDGRAAVQKYMGNEVYIEIPDEIDGIQINSIDYGFGTWKMRRVIIPASITNVAPGAFIACQELEEFRVAAKNPCLAEIDGVLFSKADKRLIQYPAMRGETYYEIPEGIKRIQAGAFTGCSSLCTIAIPDSVEKIDPIYLDDNNGTQICITNPCIDSANLESYQISNDHRALTVINNALYTRDGKMLISCPPASIPFGVGSQYTVFEGTEVIGAAAFGGCVNLSEVHLPDSLKVIDYGAFAGCVLLNEIIIPDSVSEIHAYAFSGCGGMSKVTLPSRLKSIEEGVFSECSSLFTITLPETIESIGDKAFAYCLSLRELTIPRKTKLIGQDAFRNTTTLLHVPAGGAAEACITSEEYLYDTY